MLKKFDCISFFDTTDWGAHLLKEILVLNSEQTTENSEFFHWEMDLSDYPGDGEEFFSGTGGGARC